MFSKSKSRAVLEAEKTLVEIFRITKLHNQKSMVGITSDDLEYLADNLAKEYLTDDFDSGVKILRQAVTDYFNRSKSDGKTEVGDFIRMCYSHKRLQEEENSSRRLINYPAVIIRDHYQENIKNIKKMLREAMKPLPYNKERKMTFAEIKADPESKQRALDALQKPAVEAEGRVYSYGPKLYAKCVEVGAIAPVETIKDPELAELYIKAWTVGLTRDEKDHMTQVAARCGEKVYGL